MAARIEPFCCCNSRRLYLMRRRVTYALGGHFIALHKSMLFLSYSTVSGGHFGGHWGFSGCLLMAWQLYLMRRLRRSVLVSYFHFLCKNTHVNFCAQAAYIHDIMEFLTLRRSLDDAQAAQIRVGGLFHRFRIQIDTSTFMRRLRTYATSWDA